jgi:molybdate transport repressor ModE-like protein
MFYSKGNRIIVNAEKEMGVNLLIRYKGGKEKGGATLTETAKKIIDTFEKTKVKLNDLAKNNILKDFIKLLSDLNVMINK